MKNTIDLIGLLHDTELKEVKFENNELNFFFEFYLEDDKECIVQLKSKNVSNISCTEFFRDRTQKVMKIEELELDIDCSKAEVSDNNVEFIFDNSEKDTIIELKYTSSSNELLGNLEELQMFWDLPVTV